MAPKKSSAEVIVDGLGAAAAVSGSVVALVDFVSCQDAGATSATPDYEESIKAMGMDAELEHRATELVRDALQRHAQFLDERVQNSFAESAVAPVCGDVVPGFLVTSAAAVAAAGAAAAASAAADSARESVSAVQDSLGTERRRRRREKRNAMKFVSRALLRLWRARAASSPVSSASCLSDGSPLAEYSASGKFLLQFRQW
jgi:hypothetical protein